ncbi:efflux RND transporter permease subunit [Phocaeicola dorei]|nr:efflux RND transporter permease subunit [Phocaeicola dorei]
MQQARRRPTWDYTSTYHFVGYTASPYWWRGFSGYWSPFYWENRVWRSQTYSLEENSKNVHQYTMKYKGRLEKPEEFGNMVIRSLPNGEVLRLKDVATIKLGAQNYVINGQIDGHPAATCMIFQTAGSNANEVVGEINDYLEIIEKELPKDVKIAHLMSTKDLGMQVSFRLTTYL